MRPKMDLARPRPKIAKIKRSGRLFSGGFWQLIFFGNFALAKMTLEPDLKSGKFGTTYLILPRREQKSRYVHPLKSWFDAELWYVFPKSYEIKICLDFFAPDLRYVSSSYRTRRQKWDTSHSKIIENEIRLDLLHRIWDTSCLKINKNERMAPKN